MLMQGIRYMKGYVRIRMIGYSAERFLNACAYRNIYIWGLRPVNGNYELNMYAKDFLALKPILKKTGIQVKIIKKTGFPFWLHHYRKRRMFFLGAAAGLGLIIFMSSIVWSIDITGNLTRSDDTLLKFLKEKQVKSGMFKTQVDCGRIVKDIRKEYDDIVWVSASMEGSHLKIQIKENEDADLNIDKDGKEPEQDPYTAQVSQPMDIVADEDCVLTKIVVRKGVTEFAEGMDVKKGDVLVSGQVPVKNDAGEIVDYQYYESDADISGQVRIIYQDLMEPFYMEKEYQKKCYSFFIRTVKQEVEILPQKSRAGMKCEKWSEVWPGVTESSFEVPMSCGIKRYFFYTEKKKKYTEKEIKNRLTERFRRYCRDLEKKGVEIIENNVKIYTGSNETEAKGNLVVIMPIGEEVASVLLEPQTLKEQEESGE